MIKPRSTIAALVLSASMLVGIALHEDYRGVAYIPVLGDVPTLGFGATKGVKLGDKTTPPRALANLLTDVSAHSEGIKKCIKVPLYQYEFDAYGSLAYNIGVGAFCKSSLVAKLNAQDYAGGCTEILRWNKAGGRVLAGLTKRRQDEYKTCTGAPNV